MSTLWGRGGRETVNWVKGDEETTRERENERTKNR